MQAFDDKTAASRYEGCDRLKKFGRENGTLDGTFVTPQTSLEEDLGNQCTLDRLVSRADRDLAGNSGKGNLDG